MCPSYMDSEILSHSWKFNGVTILGETSAELTIYKASNVNEGTYICNVVNSSFVTVSRAYKLHVEGIEFYLSCLFSVILTF